MIERMKERRGKKHNYDYDLIPAAGMCDRTGKLRHISRTAAKKHAKSLKKRNRNKDYVTFACYHCKSWHVGSRLKMPLPK